ncbi:MAG: regulatory protein RecX, partial [Armatimonadetes bacterium]|nr:regulatory protein RecX [Candidatus Hippobium faecium]
KALSLLNYRDRTTYELKRKLLEHKFDEKEIEYTVSRLVSEKYIDDDNFISSYINYHKSSASKAKIIQKLWLLGIPNELIQTKINEIYPEDEEYSSCLEAMTNKLRSPSCDREKLIRHLMYKGYKYSTVSQVLRDHFPQEKN